MQGGSLRRGGLRLPPRGRRVCLGAFQRRPQLAGNGGLAGARRQPRRHRLLQRAIELRLQRVPP